MPLITSRSSKENNDSLFPCRNEAAQRLNDFLVTLCLGNFDLTSKTITVGIFDKFYLHFIHIMFEMEGCFHYIKIKSG